MRIIITTLLVAAAGVGWILIGAGALQGDRSTASKLITAALNDRRDALDLALVSFANAITTGLNRPQMQDHIISVRMSMDRLQDSVLKTVSDNRNEELSAAVANVQFAVNTAALISQAWEFSLSKSCTSRFEELYIKFCKLKMGKSWSVVVNTKEPDLNQFSQYSIDDRVVETLGILYNRIDQAKISLASLD